MKTKRLLLALLCLTVLMPLSAVAQNNNFSLPLLGEPFQTRAEILTGPILKTLFEEGDRSGFFMFYLTEMPMFPDFKEEFGITGEQIQQFRLSTHAIARSEEFGAIFGELARKLQNDPDYILTEDENARLESAYRYAMAISNIKAAEAFTDEQMQMIGGMMLALTGGLQSPFFSEKHMDALDMTDEQREKFKTIYEETKPDRDRMIAQFDSSMQNMIKTGRISIQDFLAAMATFRNSGRHLGQRRMEVLTSEQIARATELSKLPRSMTFSIFNQLPGWVPGADSWRPDMPIPEVYQQERTTRGNFPRPEN